MVQHVNVKGQLEADSLGQGGWSEQGEFLYGSCLSPLFTKGLVCGSGEESCAQSFVEAERKRRGEKVKSYDRWLLVS